MRGRSRHAVPGSYMNPKKLFGIDTCWERGKIHFMQSTITGYIKHMVGYISCLGRGGQHKKN